LVTATSFLLSSAMRILLPDGEKTIVAGTNDKVSFAPSPFRVLDLRQRRSPYRRRLSARSRGSRPPSANLDDELDDRAGWSGCSGHSRKHHAASPHVAGTPQIGCLRRSRPRAAMHHRYHGALARNSPLRTQVTNGLASALRREADPGARKLWFDTSAEAASCANVVYITT